MALTRADGSGAPTATSPALPSRRRTRRVHALSIVVLAVGLAVTATLLLGAESSIRSGNDRVLRAELHQVSDALQASVPAIQQPLLAGTRIASTVSVAQFRAYEAAEVGDPGDIGLFQSVSLWHRTPSGLRLVGYVGMRPEIMRGNARAWAALRSLRASDQLGLIGLVRGPMRVLGFAERAPGRTRDLVVYAEDPLPADARLRFPANSPFVGLNFELFDGRTLAMSQLIERDVPLPLPGPTYGAAVRYGSGIVTIVAVLSARPPGVLPPEVLWLISLGGILLTLVAAITTEQLARHREAAVLAATDTQERYDTLRGVSETLQHSLLPPERPTFPGIELSGAYLAGIRQLGVGGDWYDAIPIDEDHVFLSVGDVAGKGHQAATVMSSLRHAIRAYAVQGDPPGLVLAKLNDLVERRGVAVDEGLGALCDVASGVRGTIDHVVETVLTGVVPDGSDDDLAILAVRWPELAASKARVPDPFTSALSDGSRWRPKAQRSFPCAVESVEGARTFVGGHLAGMSTEQRHAAALLVSELASNAVLHARSAFDVEVARDAAGSLRVTVADVGVGAPRLGGPPSDRTSGHGLGIVAQLSTRWGVERSDGGAKRVWFEIDAGDATDTPTGVQTDGRPVGSAVPRFQAGITGVEQGAER